MAVTADQKVTLYGVARAALKPYRDGRFSAASAEREMLAVMEALAWAANILEIESEPEMVGAIANDVILNGCDLPEARLDKLLSHTRALEHAIETANKTIAEQDALLDKLGERIGALIGSSITNDNGVQVTVVVPAGVWESIRRFVDPEVEDG